MAKAKTAPSKILFTVLTVLCALHIMRDQAAAMFSAQDGMVCGGCGTFVIGLIVLNIVILVWVTKDAKARGTSGVGWLIATLLFGPIALIVYIFSRPKGDVTECPICHNKRLSTMAQCPHCGNANVQIRQGETVSPASSAQKFCPECGAKVEPGNAFCQECGKSLS